MKTKTLPGSEGVVIRAYSPIGFYPEYTVNEPDLIFNKFDGIIFSAAKYNFNYHDDFYSEVTWLLPSEVKLICSLMFSLDCGYGLIRPYPINLRTLKEVEGGLDLTNFSHQEITKSLYELLGKHPFSPDPKYFKTPNPFFRDFIPFPKQGVKLTYEYNENGKIKEFFRIYNNLDLKDHILFRGLSTLIKANMLFLHEAFLEEATVVLYISLEASYQLVKRKIQKEKGFKKITDQHFKEFFDKYDGKYSHPPGYFKEYYEDRVKTIHPKSRFGTIPIAPLLVDDFIHLQMDLIEIYKLLIAEGIKM